MGKYFYLVIWDWWWRWENPFYSRPCGLWLKSTFLCCPWIFCAVLHQWGRGQLWFLPLCSLVYSHFWHSHGAQVSKKQLSGNFSKWEEDGGGRLKDEDNLWIPSLLPRFDDFVNIRTHCLVCFAGRTSGEEYSHLFSYSPIMFVLMA